MNEPKWIAETSVIFVKRDGTRVPGTIRIGLPGPGLESESKCVYSLDPIEKERPIYGADHLQALLLSLSACAAALARFEERGGSIEYPPADAEGARVRWDPETTFGALFRHWL